MWPGLRWSEGSLKACSTTNSEGHSGGNLSRSQRPTDRGDTDKRTLARLPTFRLVGVPQEQKRRVVYESGHNIPRPDLIRETLDWLDRYLGPVK